MDFVVAHSSLPASEAAAQELVQALGPEARAVLFFASPVYDLARIGSLLQAAWPGAVVLGCTSAGEIVSGQMLKQSVVAMAIGEEAVEDVAAAVVDLADADGVRRAFRAFESHTGMSMQALDPSAYVGLVLLDGLSRAEERVIDQLGDLTNVGFVGGSAGDDLRFEATTVVVGGTAYANAAVLALLKPRLPFQVVKTQSFRRLGRELVPTRVREGAREVLAFDGRPALEAYAEALGLSVDEAPAAFIHHPVGVMVDDEPFVRSPQRVSDDGIVFYCDVNPGMPLSLLESQDVVRDTAQALRDVAGGLGGLSAVVNFHCILRTLELEARGETEAYGAVFSGVPTVGFSTYGEAYLGHINQTSTMLVFGRRA